MELRIIDGPDSIRAKYHGRRLTSKQCITALRAVKDALPFRKEVRKYGHRNQYRSTHNICEGFAVVVLMSDAGQELGRYQFGRKP